MVFNFFNVKFSLSYFSAEQVKTIKLLKFLTFINIKSFLKLSNVNFFSLKIVFRYYYNWERAYVIYYWWSYNTFKMHSTVLIVITTGSEPSLVQGTWSLSSWMWPLWNMTGSCRTCKNKEQITNYSLTNHKLFTILNKNRLKTQIYTRYSGFV